MSDIHEFHAVFSVLSAPGSEIRYGDLARRFRSRATRLDRNALKTMLADLVRRRALVVFWRGRAEWYGAGPEAREVLTTAPSSDTGVIRYRADRVRKVLAVVLGAGRDDRRVDLIEAVRDLARGSATGLITLAALKRFTGLSRSTLHAQVKAAVASSSLLLHPIAASHQEKREDLEEGIRTPGGQNLYYVECTR